MPGDVPSDELRAALHRTADLIADYLAGVSLYPVLPRVSPGEITASLPPEPPRQGEPLTRILDDYARLIEPNVTHWNHPGFMGYFAISGSGPGIIGEALTAALNVNAMLWRTSPAASELEELVCDWLRGMMGLPASFRGHINDTASISTLLALAAGRHRLAELEVRQRGLAGRSELPSLVVYTSDQAHSSVDKAVMTLGLGLDNVCRLPADGVFRLKPESLEQAIAADRLRGRRPMAVVATAGTTSTTSVDPLAPIAEICRREKLWLHVDAAYAGSAAICPETRHHFVGWENADSIVVNPHKWLFTPIDCSVLFVRDLQQLKSTFSLVPDYLQSPETEVTNLMDLGVQLGRRFRALKLWMVIRYFGVEGLQERIREHCRLAAELARWLEADPHFELAAPVPFSTVCFRWLAGEGQEERNRCNKLLLDEINRDGRVLLSHASLDGWFTLRASIGNIRTTAEHIEQTWKLIRAAADRLSAG